MFYEYAVDPTILNNISNCQTFFESFKHRPYRLISDTPKRWMQDAYYAINQLPHDQCPPVMRKTLKENLRKLSVNNLCSNRSVDDWTRTINWLDFALVEHAKYPFAAILTANSNSEESVYNFPNLFLKSPSCWDLAGQQHINRDAVIMIEAVLPLLKVSKQLILVDPHFSFIRPTWERYKTLLKKLIEKANEFNFGKGIFKVEIHTSDKNGGIQQQLELQVKPWLPEGMAIHCYQWPKNQMHDRFILTDVGGIYFGHGLDEHADGRLEDVLVSVLDHQTYKKEKAKLSGTPVNHSVLVGEK